MHDRLTIDSQTVTRTVSIGVAAGMPGRDDVGDLLRRADEAVLASKRAGGNRTTVASDNSLKQLIRNDIELHRQSGIGNDALLLDYLPEVDLWTGAIAAAEAPAAALALLEHGCRRRSGLPVLPAHHRRCHGVAAGVALDAYAVPRRP